MNPDQGTELRSGRVINSSSETSPTDPDMAQANSNDSDTNDNSGISSQLSEIKESYERRNNELHQEFSQLKDLMMAIVSKNNNESQPSSSKGPSKPTQQQGFDTDLNTCWGHKKVEYTMRKIIKGSGPILRPFLTGGDCWVDGLENFWNCVSNFRITFYIFCIHCLPVEQIPVELLNKFSFPMYYHKI